MIKKSIVALLLLNIFAFAAQGDVDSLKVNYENGSLNIEACPLEFEDEVRPAQKDWIGLYKKNDSNSWGNVLTWAWAKELVAVKDIGGCKSLTKHLNQLANGEYEVRYFKNNSFTTFKKSKPLLIGIDNKIAPARVEYLSIKNQNFIKIVGQGTNLFVKPKDWIGIYEAKDNNSWNNVIEWVWAKDTHFDPTQDLGNPYRLFKLKKHYISTKKYEARYFQNNSFTTYKKSKPFSVSNNTNKINLDFINAISREPNKVTIYVVGVRGQAKPNPKDWIGIYKKGDSNDWKNVVTWVWVKDFISGPGDLPEEKYPEESRTTLKLNVNNEEYEARYFLNNSFTTYMKSKPFQVK